MLSIHRSSAAAKVEALRVGNRGKSSSGVSSARTIVDNAMSHLTAGLSGTNPDGTLVNAIEIKQALWNIRREVYQRSVARKILSDMIDPGWEMFITMGDERYDFSESEKKNQKEVLHNFAHECYLHLMAIGFVVVGADARGSGVRVPFVVPTEYINVLFLDSPLAARRYWIERKDASKSVLDVTLYVLDKPDSHGHLTSVGSQLLNDSRRSIRALLDHEKAAHESARPTWIIQSTGKGLPRRPITEEDEMEEGELDAMYQEHALQQGSLDVRCVDQMLAIKQQQHQQNIRVLQTDSAYADLSAGVTELPPSANNFVPPTGTDVKGPPMPQFDPHMIETLDRADRRVLTAYEMPPSLMDASRSSARFSSQSDVGVSNYFRMIQNRQEQLAVLLKDAYVRTCGDVFDIFVQSIVRASLDIELSPSAGQGSRRRAETPPPGASSADEDGDGASTTRARTNDSAADADDNEQQPELPKLKKLANGDTQLQETAQSVQRAAVIGSVPVAKISELEREVRAGISLELMFNRRMLVDQADVIVMYDKMMLRHDKASAVLADLSAMPRSYMLAEDELEEEARRRKKIADLLTPESEKKPKPAPGAALAPKKPAARPKAPSASGKKTAAAAASKSKRSAATPSKASRSAATDTDSSDTNDDDDSSVSSSSRPTSAKRKKATKARPRKRAPASTSASRRRDSDTD